MQKHFFYFIQNKKIKSVISSLVAGSVRVMLAVVRLLAAVSVIPGKEGERELPPVGQQEK